MAEEKPLFLIDVDRAIEGLLSATPKSGSSPIQVESIVMHCVDLANALDGAGLEELSGFAQELAAQFKANQAQSRVLANEFITLINSGVTQIHPGDAANLPVTDEVLKAAKASFAAKLALLKAGEPISTESIEVASSAAHVEQNPTSASAVTKPAEEVVDDTFPNQEFSSEIFHALRTKKAGALNQDPAHVSVQIPVHTEARAPSELMSGEKSQEKTLYRDENELSHLFSPRKESPPVLFTRPEPKPCVLPEHLTKPIDRESAFEYSSKARYLDKHYILDRSSNLNRMQNARSLVSKSDNWSGVEVDFLLGREQDELVRSGQQSLRHIFENLTEELLIDEVYADPDIAQQLLTILSILPPCPSIFAVQQELMIFVDLDHVTLPSEHLLAVSNMMAEIGGSLEIHHDGARLSCPSSLLRMPMAFFTRHGEQYAVSAIQYLGEEPLSKAVDSKVDFLGEIIHPARNIYMRAGNHDYVIHAHEFLGVQNMNVHQNLPKSLERPYWMAGVALDGANNVYSWVALDRHIR